MDQVAVELDEFRRQLVPQLEVGMPIAENRSARRAVVGGSRFFLDGIGG
jgi:hypothetical protein